MSLRRELLRAAASLVALACVCHVAPRAQTHRESPAPTKEIAVTIDDLPLNGPQFEAARLRAMTDKLLDGIKRHRVPAVGFVNESLLYVSGEADARIAILRAWADAGVELGNHTFSHLSFRSATPAEYEDDFVRGDALTRMLMKERGQRPRYFRHPFLHMGATAELEKSFRSFIAGRGYSAAPVTVDTMDWMFLAAYSKARARGDSAELRRVSDEYLKYVGLRLDFTERVSSELFGRHVKHVLLLHANELNADNFDALVRVFTDKGYRFITLERALGDPVYQFPEKYTATSDWLTHWSFSRGREFNPPAPPDFIRKAFAGQ
ncbi:MAG TPA: polysaccharide deacetylase family protein [Pyrinomonadaceae bacterium]|nr:polysaccharide deacetylase family protein [Pyrinomonadaceae bacterium]